MSDRSGNRSDSDAPPGPSHQQPPSESAQAEHAAEDDGSESDGSWHTVDSSDDGDDSDGGGDHDLAAPGGANVDLIDEFAAADNGDVWDDGGLDFDLGDEFDGESDEEDGAGLAAAGFGCSHYQRNCRMVAPCCGKEYWCRHCHNEAEETVEAMTRVPPTSHTLDRYAVTEVVCAQCNTRQPVSNLCSACGIQFGTYFCSICNFWDHRAAEKKYYHCDGCGICRVGGQENFVHCDECGHCISRQSLDDGTHRHKPGSMKQDCPCCLEDLFTSTRSSAALPCGHNVHVHCFQQFAKSQPWTRCPLCRKTAMPPHMRQIMSLHIDNEIARTPVPPDLQAMFPSGVSVRCYDCASLSQVSWHFFGMKCSSCGSYNTNPDG